MSIVRVTWDRISMTGKLLFMVCALLSASYLLEFIQMRQLLACKYCMTQPLPEPKKEVFGFLPYWVFDERSENIDYDVLTTLAYFGIDVSGSGDLDLIGSGYRIFTSERATEIFQQADNHGTRVVLTITQMNNPTILAFLDDPAAQLKAVEQTAKLVRERGIDGVNIDFEYMGDPGDSYREKFTLFSQLMKTRLIQDNSQAYLTVSVYASAAKYPKIYNLTELSKVTDGIFMMAYDFAVANSKIAMPTSPLYGHAEGEYWYDVSTAVDDFLALMPADKLILGLPWYGYNYPVSQPGVGVPSFYRGIAQTYGIVKELADPVTTPSMVEGWDDLGKVGYKAYHTARGGWRMIFMEDIRSLGYKYDFAKEKNLAGVGMWAIGFQDGSTELWQLLREKFS